MVKPRIDSRGILKMDTQDFLDYVHAYVTTKSSFPLKRNVLSVNLCKSKRYQEACHQSQKMKRVQLKPVTWWNGHIDLYEWNVTTEPQTFLY